MKYLTRFLKILLTFTALISVVIAVLFGHSDIPLNELKSKYANASSSFISVNGMEVHYRDSGNSTDAVPIVLLHGTASSLHTFNSWAQGLENSNRVISLDLPAFGLTGPFQNKDYNITHYTSFLNDFLTALKVKQCILAGNSLGGEIAWNFALEQPEKVKKLILIDASGYPTLSKSRPIAFSLGQVPVLKKLFTYITPRFMVRASIENVYADKIKVTDSLVNRFFDLSLRAGNRQAFIDRLAVSKNNNYTKIKEITQPTLIVWGAKDLLIPVENAYKFHKDLPKASLVILKNSGHTPMEENPLESLVPVMNFLKVNH